MGEADRWTSTADGMVHSFLFFFVFRSKIDEEDTRSGAIAKQKLVPVFHSLMKRSLILSLWKWKTNNFHEGPHN